MNLNDLELFFDSIQEAKPITINGCEYIKDPIATAKSFIFIIKTRSTNGCYKSYTKKLVKIYEEVKKSYN